MFGIFTAKKARQISLQGLADRKKDQLDSILKHIEQQAKFGSTAVECNTVYELDPDTIPELSRRGFAVLMKPKGEFSYFGSTLYVSWGIPGVVPIWQPDWVKQYAEIR